MLGLGSSLVTSETPYEFLPENVSSLIHWYKHAEGLEDAGGAFPDDDEKIIIWRDSKGSNDATSLDTDDSGTDSSLWDNTNKAVVSDAIGGFTLASRLTLGSFSMYFRIQFVQTPTTNDIFTRQNPPDHNNMFVRIQAANLFRAKIAGTTRTFQVATAADSSSLTTGQYYNIGFERDSSNNLRVYKDGVESTTGALTDSSDIIIDRLECGQEDLYITTLIFNDALSDSTRRNLEIYLSNI